MGQNLRDIRRRIRGVRNIQQVTRAMDMVASARLRRAQARVEAARPYSERMQEILRDLQAIVASLDHPLLRARPVARAGIVVLTSDRGLCGAYNSNVLREAELLIESLGQTPYGVIAIGRKGIGYYRRHAAPLDTAFPSPGTRPTLEEIRAIAQHLIGAYLAGQYDRIDLVFTRFVSTMRGEPVSVPLLPLARPGAGREAAPGPLGPVPDYLFEPSAAEVLGQLLPQYVEVLVQRALLDAVASEQAARMVAMRNATDNANDLILELTKTYNRVRQTSITTQILEVVSGANALREAHDRE